MGKKIFFPGRGTRWCPVDTTPDSDKSPTSPHDTTIPTRTHSMPRPRGKKASQYHQAHIGISSQKQTDEGLSQTRGTLVASHQYTNDREPYDDTESVEEVADDESVPDAFKKRKRVRSSHIWLPENGIEHITPDGVKRWKCQRCMCFYSTRT